MGSGEDDSEDVGVRSTQASSLVSVLMVNRSRFLTPSQSHEDRFSRPPWRKERMDWYSRNLRGGSRTSSLTCHQPWLRLVQAP